MCARNDRSRTSSSKTDNDRARSSSRHRSSSRSRSVHRRPSTTDTGKDKRRRSRSASLGRRRRSSTATPKKEYDTPFDIKGRCHHHPNIQLARRKLTGGWKVCVDNCPKCSEERCRSNRERSRSLRRSRSISRSVAGDRSVSSRRSTRSSRSVSPGRRKILSVSNDKVNEKIYPFDDKGYCHRHSNVRLAKKKFTGGWKILLVRCHKCVSDEKESRSVCSKSSHRSRSRSVCSRSSRHDGRRQTRGSSDPSSELVSKKRSVKKMTCTNDTDKEGFYIGHVVDQGRPHDNDKQMATKTNGAFTCAAMSDGMKHRRKCDPKIEAAQEQVSIGEFENSDDFERQWQNEVRMAKHCIEVVCDNAGL